MRRVALVLTASCGLAIAPANAQARTSRRYFEPTDLEMEEPGVLDIDVQFGLLREQEPWRVTAPDFELDLGLGPTVELELDGAYHVDGTAAGPFHDPSPTFENLWLAAKLGLYDSRSVPSETQAWAVGVQLGPKLPAAMGARGAGYEALLLLSNTSHGRQVVLNAGGFVDPGDGAQSPRPKALEGGLDLSLDLGKGGLTLTGELGAVHFVSSDPDQLEATAGVTWAANDQLDLSLVGLVGWGGADHAGVLLGVSPKFRIWP